MTSISPTSELPTLRHSYTQDEKDIEFGEFCEWTVSRIVLMSPLFLVDKASSTDPEKNVQIEIVPEETDTVVRGAADIATQVLRDLGCNQYLSTYAFCRFCTPMTILLYLR